MSAPEKIWLDPECTVDADYHVDQRWHSVNPGPCDECGMEPTNYTRTDLIPSDPRVKALVDAASRLISVERDSACEMRAVDDVEAAIATLKGAANE